MPSTSEVGAVEALTEATVTMLENEPRRQQMAEASQVRHEEAFTVDRMVELTAAVYDEVVPSARPTRDR